MVSLSAASEHDFPGFLSEYLKKMKNQLQYPPEEWSESPLKPHQMQLSWQFDESPRTIARRRPVSPGRRTVKPVPRFVQPTLPLPQPVEEGETAVLERRIQAHMRGKLELTVTDNRSSIISVKRLGGVFKVRLHHMFLNAEPRILRSLGRYIEKADAESSTILEQFIESNSVMIREQAPASRAEETRTKGEVHDLQEIYDRINRRYFSGGITARVTWGRENAGSSRHHRSAKMGTYSVEDRIITIHPALDRQFVPRFFVESVMYHEMLHQVYGAPVVNGRRQYHSPAFMAAEKRFDHYHLARQWEQENINRLLYF